MPGHRAAFTLIEMLGVLAIMALLGGAASVMLGGARHAANLSDSIDQIEHADFSARSLARSSGSTVSLSITLTSGVLKRSDATSTALLGRIPGDVKIQRIRVAQQAATDFGSADILFRSRGCSATYAVLLVSSSGEKQWILFAGLTGQMLKVNDEDVDAIFQQVSNSTGTDAG